MTTAGYRLESLLRVRQQEEESAARMLAAARAARAAAQAEQDCLQQVAARDREHHEAERLTPPLRPGVPMNVAQAKEHFRFLARLAAQAQASARAVAQHRDGKLREACRAEQEAERAFVEARRAREALQMHRDRQQLASRRHAAKRAERCLDESAEVAQRYRGRS